MRVHVKGWKAIAALAVILAVVGGKLLLERTTLQSAAADELKFWLRGEYFSQGMAGIDPSALSDAEAQAVGEELLGLSQIEFTALGARGGGDDVVVRVEIRVAGADPPDGRRVRYFRMSHSTVSGWRVQRETGALSYYLKLF